MENIQPTERDLKSAQVRFCGMIDLEEIRKTIFDVIGVGAVGSQIADSLVRMGAEHIRLFDPDKVDIPNIGTQGYSWRDIGQYKTDVMEDKLKEINPDVKISCLSICEKWSLDDGVGNVVFMCIDNIEGRTNFVETNHLCGNSYFMVDTRMGATIYQVIAGEFPEFYSDYIGKYTFPEEESVVEPCTQRMTGWGAKIVAGLAINKYLQYEGGDGYSRVIDGNLKLDLLTQRDFCKGG